MVVTRRDVVATIFDTTYSVPLSVPGVRGLRHHPGVRFER